MISLGITYLPIYYIMCIELKEISAWCLASLRRNIVTIHLTLENSKGEVCDEGEAIYFTFGPDKAKEMGFVLPSLECWRCKYRSILQESGRAYCW